MARIYGRSEVIKNTLYNLKTEELTIGIENLKRVAQTNSALGFLLPIEITLQEVFKIVTT